MRDVAELVAGMVDRVRHTSPQVGILRVALAVACVLAIVLIRAWTGDDVAGVLLWVAGGLVVATVLLPDSAAPGLFLAMGGFWWIAGSTGAEVWQHITVVVMLAAIHILAAQAGAVPSHAALTPAASYTMVVGSGAYVVVVGLAGLLAVGVTAIGGGFATTGLALAAAGVLAIVLVLGVLVSSRQ